LFHSPHTLGPRAQALGISCNTCHPNGAAHTSLSLAPLSDRPGNIDLSTDFFREGQDDAIANPVNIPSLRGCRYTAPYGADGRDGSLAEFVANVVTREFGGAALPDGELAALVRYIRDFDFLPNAKLDPHSRLHAAAGEAARRGERVFNAPRAGFGGESCASCHPASTFFRDGRVHRLGSGSPPSPSALDGGYETPTLLGIAETAPYFHDGRFATLAEVIEWFDGTFALGLSPEERSDLNAYLTAVGAIDRSRDDRPLARELDDTFAYAALLRSRRPPSVWIAAIDAILALLREPPPAVAARALEIAQRLVALHARVAHGGDRAKLAAEVSGLRSELARLAADWAGAVDPA
jgi:Di-haem cytochrome c peroxidase